MIHTPLCDLLGIQYPVFQGGMAWIADGKLAAAVSEGGGLGIIAAGNAPAEALREQIQIAKSLTKKPFGVNIMLMSPFVEEVAQLVAEEYRHIDGNDPRYRLGQSKKLASLLIGDDALLAAEFVLYQRQHHNAAAKGHAADLKISEKYFT